MRGERGAVNKKKKPNLDIIERDDLGGFGKHIVPIFHVPVLVGDVGTDVVVGWRLLEIIIILILFFFSWYFCELTSYSKLLLH